MKLTISLIISTICLTAMAIRSAAETLSANLKPTKTSLVWNPEHTN